MARKTADQTMLQALHDAEKYGDSTVKTSGFGIGELGHTPASTAADEIEAERLQPTVQRDLVKCACGHMCPRRLVMSTSSGDSCPDCYDRMDNC